MNLAEEMVGEGRLHAALAHLQGLPRELPEVRLRQARILRSLGRADAENLYLSLLDTCLAAAGQHGLGQLAAARGDEAQALARLEQAARLAPIDAQVRNDLGVVYLRQGRVGEARFEFLTALELDRDDPLPAVNMLALLFFEDKWQQAAELVSRLGLSLSQVHSAEERARRIKERLATESLPAADEQAPGLALGQVISRADEEEEGQP